MSVTLYRCEFVNALTLTKDITRISISIPQVRGLVHPKAQAARRARALCPARKEQEHKGL